VHRFHWQRLGNSGSRHHSFHSRRFRLSFQEEFSFWMLAVNLDMKFLIFFT
jgi:hypothetical protein